MHEKEWAEAVSTIGSIYRDTYNALKKEGRQSILTNVMYEKGIKAGKKLGLKSIEDLKKALEKLYRQNRIKASMETKEGKLHIEITGCEWNKLEGGGGGWGPEHCASIEAYEKGLLDSVGIEGAQHKCTSRRSNNAQKCVLVLG